MESLKELYRIGTGPSSSHTMGPERAAHRFKEKYPQADRFLVTLYGSLAKTGKGHLTDDILVKTFAPLPVEIRFDLSDKPLPHPNTLELTAIENDKEIGFERVMSVGGGKILSEGETEDAPADVYPLSTFADIKAYCASRHMRLWQYAEECEGTEIWDYLKEVWRCMREAVTRGLETEGTLKGGLDVQRKAKMLYRQNHIDESAETRENRLVCAYAYAVSEENAAGGIIVTAPTCGSCGVLPSVLLYMQERRGFTDTEILHALAAGGIIGDTGAEQLQQALLFILADQMGQQGLDRAALHGRDRQVRRRHQQHAGAFFFVGLSYRQGRLLRRWILNKNTAAHVGAGHARPAASHQRSLLGRLRAGHVRPLQSNGLI